MSVAPCDATQVSVPSDSKRWTCVTTPPSRRLTSSATADSTVGAGCSRTTSVATRRSAACSSTSRCTSALLASARRAAWAAS